MEIKYFCEFCGMEIAEGDVTVTSEGGEVRHCQMKECTDKLPARVAEVDAKIAGWKEDEAARLQAEYSDLKTELAKPVYDGKTDSQIIDYMNDPDNGEEYDDPIISIDDFNSSQDSAEYAALTDSQKLDLLDLKSGTSIDLSHAATITKLDGVFSSETVSRVAVEALRTKKRTIAATLGLNPMMLEYITRARKT